MLSNIINSQSIRNEMLDFIVNILIDVNEKVVLNYFNKLTPKDIDIKSSTCLLYTSPSPRDGLLSRMPSSA